MIFSGGKSIVTQEELLLCCRETDAGVIFSCHVRPGASKSEVMGLYGESMKLSLKAPPVDGKANKELCRFLAETCGASKSAAELVSGQTSRDKKVLLNGYRLKEIIPFFTGK